MSVLVINKYKKAFDFTSHKKAIFKNREISITHTKTVCSPTSKFPTPSFSKTEGPLPDPSSSVINYPEIKNPHRRGSKFMVLRPRIQVSWRMVLMAKKRRPNQKRCTATSSASRVALVITRRRRLPSMVITTWVC